MGKTIFEKIWDIHVIEHLPDGNDLLHIDRCYAHDLSGTMAYRMMKKQGYKPLNPALTISVPDHTLASKAGRTSDDTPISRSFIPAFEMLSKEMGIRMFGLNDPRQGVVHVVGPETGVSLPGLTAVCGDSHTCTHGALGMMAWGIGVSELYHVVTTQSILARKPKLMRIRLEGTRSPDVAAMDVILFLIARNGAGFCTGYAVEFAGPAIAKMEIEERMTICNLTVEMGSEYAIMNPDDKTFAYIEGREFAPRGQMMEQLVRHARQLCTDEDAVFDLDITIDIATVRPQISWGISPEQTIGIEETIPGMDVVAQDESLKKALAYMGFEPGQRLLGIPIQRVFIGSCSNGRLSNLLQVAEVVAGKHVAAGVEAWIVPGSQPVKCEAERLGLDRIFRTAGFLWGEPGCSLCGGCNGERVEPLHRCVSTTNRNFIGRQGPQSRTHLASPVTAALAALHGRIVSSAEGV